MTANDAAPAPSPETGHGFSRRSFLGAGLGAFGAGALTGGAGGYAFGHDQATEDLKDADPTLSYPFYDEVHQGGVVTPPQRSIIFAALDLTTTDVQDLQVLLARWSAAIAQMQRGEPIGTVEPTRGNAVPTDTGEAYEAGPNGLTVTVGLGPGVFDSRYGLSAWRPATFTDLPALPSDDLDPALTGGDLSIQACANDPQVAYHALRDLALLARGTAVVRWTVMGFGRASAGAGQTTPRNLMGFKDGTRNASTTADQESFVWLDTADQPWLAGGTYQVVRKVKMHIENWDADFIADQQQVFGRTKKEGAPLSGTHEHDTPDFTMTGADGALVIPAASHVALAAPENNDGLKILRRGYNYTDGLNELGQLDAGLLFIAYMNDPQAFITLQTKLGRSDLLNEYISHIGSAVFVVPPAPATGHYLAEELFA